MTIQTFAQVLALATSCQHLVPPYILAHDVIQVGEWHNAPMHDDAVSPPNTNGTRDYGIASINSANFEWLGLTPQTAMDPCRSIAAAAIIFGSFASYNSGNPASKAGIEYALRIIHGRVAQGSPDVTSGLASNEHAVPVTPDAQPEADLHDAVHIHRIPQATSIRSADAKELSPTS